VLGDLHDLEVLTQYCSEAVAAMPTVATHLQSQYRKLWSQWEGMEPLNPSTSPAAAAVLLAVLSPPAESVSVEDELSW
jgi:hypothetical protein